MERNRKTEPGDDGLTAGIEVDSRDTPVPEAADPNPNHKPAKLMPRPDKGRTFPEALQDSMRDHRNVYAALAK